jgi:hypothetical protein
MSRTTLTAALLVAFAALPCVSVAQTGAQKPESERAKALKDAALDAQIRSYRCVGTDGKKYYGATRPAQCAFVAVEGLSAQGTVIRRFDAPLTPEQRAARDAEAQKNAEKNAAAEVARLEAENAAKVQKRRDQALLQTYASEKDIESVRLRALADNMKAQQDVGRRIDALKKKQDELAKQAAAIKAGKAPSDTFEQDVRAVAYDLQLQDRLLESRKKEAESINAKYAEEKRKYLELTKGPAK